MKNLILFLLLCASTITAQNYEYAFKAEKISKGEIIDGTFVELSSERRLFYILFSKETVYITYKNKYRADTADIIILDMPIGEYTKKHEKDIIYTGMYEGLTVTITFKENRMYVTETDGTQIIIFHKFKRTLIADSKLNSLGN